MNITMVEEFFQFLIFACANPQNINCQFWVGFFCVMRNFLADVSVSATLIQRVTWCKPFQFLKKINYVIFITSNLHSITIAAVL